MLSLPIKGGAKVARVTIIVIILLFVIFLVTYFLFVYSPYTGGPPVLPAPPKGWNSTGTTTVTENANGAICIFNESNVGCGSYAFSGLLRVPLSPFYSTGLWFASVIVSIVALGLFGYFSASSKARRSVGSRVAPSANESRS